MEKTNLINKISLAYNAKKVVISGDNVLNEFKKNNIYLIFVACDFESNLKEKVLKKAQEKNIKYIDILTIKEISLSVKNENIKILGISDPNLSKLILMQL